MLPKEAPYLVIVEDPEVDGSYEKLANVDIENTFQEGTCFFSTFQDPTNRHSIFGTSCRFSFTIMKLRGSNLLTIGDSYANVQERCMEDIIPFAFLFGIGGPKMNRHEKVPTEAYLQRFMQVAMPQFMRGGVILTLNHIHGKQLFYRSGIMPCQATVNTVGNNYRRSLDI